MGTPVGSFSGFPARTLKLVVKPSASRRAYPRDVTDEEWAFVLPYLLLLREDAGQRQYALRELFNALRYVVRTGCT